MARGVLTRWFGLGRMPAFVRDRIAGERVLYETEGIRVTRRRNGRVPGSASRGAVSVGWGSFAVTDRRVVGSRGRVSWLHVTWDEATGGPATLTFDGTGLHVVFDLDRLHHATRGELRVDFRQVLTDADLGRFPARQVTFTPEPQKVVRLWGSLLRLPE